MPMRPSLLMIAVVALAGPAVAADVVAVPERPAGWVPAPAQPLLTVGGHALDRATVEALPLKSTVLETKWGLKGTFHGAALADLLDRNGMGDADKVRVSAVDGYAITLTRQEILRERPVLASRLDGAPLGDGTMGPYIVLWPAAAEAVLADKAPIDAWVWGVVSIDRAP